MLRLCQQTGAATTGSGGGVYFNLVRFDPLILNPTPTRMEAGAIFATLAYALSFSDSLDEVPQIVQQVSRLQDIVERINTPPSA